MWLPANPWLVFFFYISRIFRRAHNCIFSFPDRISFVVFSGPWKFLRFTANNMYNKRRRAGIQTGGENQFRNFSPRSNCSMPKKIKYKKITLMNVQYYTQSLFFSFILGPRECIYDRDICRIILYNYLVAFARIPLFVISP